MNIEEKVKCRIPFGTITIGNSAKEKINHLLDSKIVTNCKYFK